MIDRIIQLALNNRLLMLVLGAVVMMSGYYGHRQLPVDAFPDVSPNLVQVFTVTEGLAPEEIETYVTYPIETVMNGLPSIENIRSVSNFGLSVVNIYFEDGVDIYFARQLVNERLQEAREQIPEGFGEPSLGPISTGMGQVLFYYLEDTSGEYSLEELRTIQDWLVKFHLQTVPGVTEVLGIGGHEKQFHVVVDPHSLLRYGVTLHEVIAQIKANNLNVGAHTDPINSAEMFLLLEPRDKWRRAGNQEELREIVRSELGDIPGVLTNFTQPIAMTVDELLEGVRAELAIKLFGDDLGLLKQKADEIAQVVNQVAGAADVQVDQIGGTPQLLIQVDRQAIAGQVALPPGYLVTWGRQFRLQQEANKRLAIVVPVTLFVLFLLLFSSFNSLRNAVLILLNIPLALVGGVAALWLTGQNLSVPSSVGFIALFGIALENSMVMVTYFNQLVREGVDLDEASIEGACLRVRPVLMTALTTALGLIPLLSSSGTGSEVQRPLATVVVGGLVSSTVLTLLVMPALYKWFAVRPDRGTAEGNLVESGEADR